MAKRCRSCCKCGPAQVITPLCDGAAPQANGADGVTVVLRDGGGATVGTGTSSGQLSLIQVTNPGSGYTSPPTVVIGAPPGGGTQAVAVATVVSGQVTAVTITEPGAGYTSSPTVSLTGGGGTGATVVRTFVHGCRFFVPGIGAYTYTASKAGYVASTGGVTLVACRLTTVTAPSLTTTIAGWPVTPLHGTDSVFGTHTLTNAGSYTTLITASGTVITGGLYTTAAGTFGLRYTLAYSTCGILLTVKWRSRASQCSILSGTLNGTPPNSDAQPDDNGCGGAACFTQIVLKPTVVQNSPLYLEYTVPAMTPACFTAPWPYPSGATISYTP